MIEISKKEHERSRNEHERKTKKITKHSAIIEILPVL